jgi:hypothetical protein
MARKRETARPGITAFERRRLMRMFLDGDPEQALQEMASCNDRQLAEAAIERDVAAVRVRLFDLLLEERRDGAA